MGPLSDRIRLRIQDALLDPILTSQISSWFTCRRYRILFAGTPIFMQDDITALIEGEWE